MTNDIQIVTFWILRSDAFLLQWPDLYSRNLDCIDSLQIAQQDTSMWAASSEDLSALDKTQITVLEAHQPDRDF